MFFFVLTSFCFFVCFVLFCFIRGRVCASRSAITALIDEMDGYLDGFKRKRDGINCILYAVGIRSIILSIHYVQTLLLLLIGSAPREIGLLTLLILNTDRLSLNLINTSAIAGELVEIDACVRKEKEEEDKQIQQEVLSMERATPIRDDTKIGMNIIHVYNVITIVAGQEFAFLTYAYQIQMQFGDLQQFIQSLVSFVCAVVCCAVAVTCFFFFFFLWFFFLFCVLSSFLVFCFILLVVFVLNVAQLLMK